MTNRRYVDVSRYNNNMQVGRRKIADCCHCGLLIRLKVSHSSQCPMSNVMEMMEEGNRKQEIGNRK